ncbi:MAG: FtsX-like permease family protein [Spirochaetes bacterium]|jgi:ABC-type lipoprotein release transport system permease subunit|nr:FtsX-like permease family protein [Spirochaetota bacterium]
MEILKIAYRSILRHKGKMIAIAVLVLFGTFLITFGQSFVDSVSYYSEKAIRDNFTGDLMIYSERSKDKPSPFSFLSPLQTIQNIDDIENVLYKDPFVDCFVPYTQNFVTLDFGMEPVDAKKENKAEDDTEDFSMNIIIGMDPIRYRSVFNNIDVLQGSFFGLADNPEKTKHDDQYTPGIMIEKSVADLYEKKYGKPIEIGQQVTLVAFTQDGSINATKTNVIGIFNHRAFKRVLQGTSLIDMKTYSQLFNFVGFETSSLSETMNQALSAENEEDIFAASEVDFTEHIKFDELKEVKLSGYTMIAIKLKKGITLEEGLEHFQKLGPQYKFKVVKWNEAAGGLDKISYTMKIFIMITTTLIFIIVGIIIMNTLIINVNERYYEIGTMRAIGASKNFVRNMFITESFIVNLFGFLVGILITVPLNIYFHIKGMAIPKMLSEILIGGGKLYFVLTPSPYILGILIIVIISILATLYPVSIATKIPPVRAMSEKI